MLLRPLSLSSQEPAEAFQMQQRRGCGLAGQGTCLVNRRPWVQIPAVPAILHELEKLSMAAIASAQE